jgi:hypothetical protein
MKHRWAALVTVLALGALVPRCVAAQGTPNPPPAGERSPGVQLGQNYPNPFSPATTASQFTTIPFAIGDPPDCKNDGGRQHRVTLRIYNVLAQLVAIPELQESGGGEKQKAVNVSLKCGTYTAVWNGNYMDTSQEVPSGVYIYLLEVNGRTIGKKMIVMR